MLSTFSIFATCIFVTNKNRIFIDKITLIPLVFFITYLKESHTQPCFPIKQNELKKTPEHVFSIFDFDNN